MYCDQIREMRMRRTWDGCVVCAYAAAATRVVCRCAMVECDACDVCSCAWAFVCCVFACVSARAWSGCEVRGRFDEGALVEPFAVGMHAATKAQLRPGDVVCGACSDDSVLQLHFAMCLGRRAWGSPLIMLM